VYDLQRNPTALCPDFLGKQGRTHGVQVEERKQKIAFTLYWDLNSGLPTRVGVTGVNAIPLVSVLIC
jgi:hypothetical protein